MNRFISKMLVRGVFMLSVAFLFINAVGLRAYSEKLYKLDNLVTNGDFLIDSNSDGLADNWNKYSNVDASIIDNNRQKGIKTIEQGTLGFSTVPSNIITGHTYYFYAEIETNSLYAINIYVGSGDAASRFKYFPNTKSYYFVTTQDIDIIYINTFDAPIGTYIILKNVMLIDMSASFGSGYIPTIADFESNYLPNVDYFDEYTTMQPDTYETIISSDFPNILEDISTVDYTKSIISNYGDNVDVAMYAYIYTGDDYISLENAYFLYDAAKPTMKYKGQIYTLQWVLSDYSNQVMTIQMSDSEKEILKRILFNRNIDTDEEYFHFDVVGHELGDTRLWFQFTNTFNLKVNIKSILFSRNIETLNDFNMVNTMFYKFFDTRGNLLEPSLRFIIGDVFESRLIDVGSRFTDISRFNIEIDVSSPDLSGSQSTSYVESHYFYELGLFSDSDVFIPSFISDSELDDMFPNQVCDVWELSCQASNTFNNIARTLYTKLNIAAIQDSITIFTDKVVLFVDLMPDAAANIILTGVIAFILIGITFVIVERYL